MVTPRDDASLVAAAQRGDRQAADELLRRHLPRMNAVCRRLLNNTADADDATQNALISIVRALPSFDGRSSFGTWAYRIATNAALDELRRRRRRPQPSRYDDDPAHEVADHHSGRSETAFDDRDILVPALAEMSEDFRVAVVLRDVADLDYDEIAQVLGIPPGTVRSRIARGRAQLAHALRPSDPPAGNQTTTSERPTAEHD